MSELLTLGQQEPIDGPISSGALAEGFTSHLVELQTAYLSAVDPYQPPDATSRFCWERWVVPGRYEYHRSPATRVLGEDLARRVVADLNRFAAQHLGSPGANTLWCSFYTDGCFQALHADVRQGWSFVLPILNGAFEGGETLLATDDLLNYWDPARLAESKELFIAIPPISNRLVLFDGRIPHAVAAVRGPRSPSEARVVLHGWFDPPTLSVDGSIDINEVRAALPQLIEVFLQGASRANLRGFGTLSTRVTLIRGEVTSVAVLTNTVRGCPSGPTPFDQLLREVCRGLDITGSGTAVLAVDLS